MSVLLFKLNGIPEDEAEDIRALLSSRDIPFYETSAGNWGVSLAAIWLQDDTHQALARSLIDDYQLERVKQARLLYQQQKLNGDVDSFWQRFRREPLRMLFFLLPVVLVVFISLTWFVGAWDS